MRKSTPSPFPPFDKLISGASSASTTPDFNASDFRQQLWEQLYALPYGSFLVLIARLLEKQGSKNVQALNRRGFVGRNRSGGWDMEAILPGQFSAIKGREGTRCIIQVKQFKDLAVQQRTVDELRGCCLRASAGMGLLITTSRFSPVARAAAQSSPLAPVGLIDGEQLLTLLVDQKLGVRQSQDGKWEVDQDYFRTLVSAPIASRVRSTFGKTQAAPRAAINVSIMVETVALPANKRSAGAKKIKVMNL